MLRASSNRHGPVFGVQLFAGVDLGFAERARPKHVNDDRAIYASLAEDESGVCHTPLLRGVSGVDSGLGVLFQLNQLQLVLCPAKALPDPPPDPTQKPLGVRGFVVSSGPDGARTRDLQRDRLAF